MTGSTAQMTAARIDEALNAFADPRGAEQAEDLVRMLMGFYGEGLGRLVELLDETPDGKAALRRIADDRLVGGLLVLHDLHPAGTRERVAQALERVRPYLGSHAGDVELLGVDANGVVRLRLKGTCDGCPASSATVTDAIERAIEDLAPEVVRVDVEGVIRAPSHGSVLGSAHGHTGPGGRTLLPVLGART